MCEMLGVSKSGYYNWLKSGPSKRWLENEAIAIKIHTIFKESFESYGAPRIKVELLKHGHRVSRPRVARLMSVIIYLPEESVNLFSPQILIIITQ